MIVKFVSRPEHDICPSVKGEAILYEISSPFIPSKPFSKYWLCCHSCGLVGNLGDHDSVQVVDGLVTISPSIQCPKCPAHYWIKDGKVVN